MEGSRLNFTLPTKDTRAPPDVSPRTHIVSVLGASEDSDSNKDCASPSLGDGWMVSDFYLWMHVLDGMGKSQKWLTSMPPEYLVQKYCGENKVTQGAEEDWDNIDEQTGQPREVIRPIQTKWKDGFLHADPFEERVVVLDSETLPHAREKVTLTPEGKDLRQKFINELRFSVEAAAAGGDPVLVMIFSHGDYDTKGCLFIGSTKRETLVTPGDLNEILSRHPDVHVCLYMTSCFSGHWVKTPVFKASNPTVLAAAEPQEESMGFVWSSSQRHAGGLFPAATMEELFKEPTKLPVDSNVDVDEFMSYRQMTRDILNTSHRLCLPASIPDYGSSPIFSDVSDGNEKFWRRTGYELHEYKRNYCKLKRVPPSDPHPKYDRKTFEADYVDDMHPRIVAWETRHPEITNPSYPEATGGYGSTRRGLGSRQNILYLADRYIASRAGRRHDVFHRMCLDEIHSLVKNELPQDRREKLRRTLQYRLSMNDHVNQYVRALGIDIVPIEEWWRARYVGEEQEIQEVVQGAGLFLRPSTPEMDVEEWGGSYPKPNWYLSRALAEAGYDVTGASKRLEELKSMISDAAFEVAAVEVARARVLDRPLSIMNVDYKIYMEILMQRLVQALSPTIGTHQYAFLHVQDRLMNDNIRTVQYAIAGAQVRKEKLGLLFLDQEKAYDRVNHRYLLAVLDRMGITQPFIRWVRAAYTNAHAHLYVYEDISPEKGGNE